MYANIWSCRYQELLLSHRCLIFLDSQVFFRCSKSVWSEDTLFDDFPQELNAHLGETQDIHPFTEMSSTQTFASYVRILLRFSGRDITDDNDVLDAMAGITRRVASKLGSGILEGLLTSYFDASILFYHSCTRPVRRRPAFPSWSWAGWSGYTHGWIPEEDTLSMAEWNHGHTFITWYKQAPETAEVSRVWDNNNPENPDKLELEGLELGAESPHPTARQQILQVVSTERSATAPMNVPKNNYPVYGYHLLRFRTYLVRCPRLEPSSESGCATIFDRDDTVCGALFVDDQAYVQQQDGPFDLILLSTGEKSCVGKGRLPVEARRPFFWAMLISRGAHVSERKALGFIFQDRIDSLLPPGKVWTEIVLA